MQKELFKQTWWDNNLKTRFNDYIGWLGNSDADSRHFIRENIKDLGIKSIADFGCGPGVEFTALTEEGYEFEYLGIDSCIHLKEINEANGIPFLNAPVEKTGLKANSYELSYSRHVLEHLPSFEDALTEMIRVSKKYVVHTFFLKPNEEEFEPNHWKEENLYHNTYNKNDIESFLKKNKKVESFEWVDINEKENALTITLK